MSRTAFLENYKLEGEKLAIVTYPNSVLSKKAEEINPDQITDELAELAKNMLYTMYLSPGIGLAAPQIGKSIRLFVIDVDYQREKKINDKGEEDFELSEFAPLVMINPKITKQEGEMVYQEGCLSVPGIYEDVKRAEKITVQYLDLDGQEQELEAEEILGVCIQHENDHLDGKVFIERLSRLKFNFYKKKILKEKLHK